MSKRNGDRAQYNIAFMERDPIDWNSSDVDYRPLLAELAAIRSENAALHKGSGCGAVGAAVCKKRKGLKDLSNEEMA